MGGLVGRYWSAHPTRHKNRCGIAREREILRVVCLREATRSRNILTGPTGHMLRWRGQDQPPLEISVNLKGANCSSLCDDLDDRYNSTTPCIRNILQARSVRRAVHPSRAPRQRSAIVKPTIQPRIPSPCSDSRTRTPGSSCASGEC